MSWFRELLLRDHIFAVWRDTAEHDVAQGRADAAGAPRTAEHSARPAMRPTIFRSELPPTHGTTAAGSVAADRWPPDDVIIRARGLLDAESRAHPTKTPFRQVVPAVLFLLAAIVALGAERDGSYDLGAQAAVVAPTEGAAAPRSDYEWRYEGPEYLVVRQLLAGAGEWTVPACDSCAGMRTPRVRIESRCGRDGVVATAVQYAWAAEAYATVGRDGRAQAAAAEMRRQLETSSLTCGGPSVARAADGCGAAALWPCPA